MRERLTARVLLLDPDDRLLLIRGRLPSAPEGPSFWFTVGGEIEAGETPRAAAAREALEETGFADVTIGAEVWYSEEVFVFDDTNQPTHFKERFFVGRTAGGPLSRAGWQDVEHRLLDELRWWTLGELRLTGDTVYPEGIAELLPDVLSGRLAPAPLVIRTVDGPIPPVPRVS
ncbi:MAG TPA: NUDIX domain-containing protein [Caulobacteraceae bacterium]